MTDQQLLDRLREWLPLQRWFPFTATPDQLRLNVVGRTDVGGDDRWESEPGTQRTIYLVQVTVGERTELLSVPVVGSIREIPELERFAIGSYCVGGPDRPLPEQLIAGAEASASFLRRAISQAGSLLERRRGSRHGTQGGARRAADDAASSGSARPGTEAADRVSGTEAADDGATLHL